MDFETSGKGGNPFLMDDYGGDTTANCNMNSNPFLSNTDFNIPVSSASEQNPFLSALAEDASTTSPFSGTTSSTNPFAFVADDFGSGMDTTTATTTTTGIDFFGGSGIEQTTTSSAGFNLFSTTDTTVVSNQTADDFFGSITTTPVPEAEKVDPIRRVSGAGFDLLDGVDSSGDASDFCKETSDIFSNVEATTTALSMADDDLSRTSTPKSGIGLPRRPPPPRPIPPSKETKDLILSVTGAMEATSSHLLDRLQMTRTPSPTPIRDLHSPSPTPDVPFSDLLGGDLICEPTEVSEPTTETMTVPPKPPPPRPAPPPRPQPPPPVAQQPVEQQQDIMDIFSSDITTQPPAPAPQTNTDILGLFDSSQPTEVAPQTTADLLLGDDFGGGGDTMTTESKEVNLMSSSPITAMDFTSEPQQQTDMFACESFPTMMEASEAPDTTNKPAAGDDFDAFAAKFENAAKDEAQEIRVVEGDPFDPFASSAGAAVVDSAGTDVWGSSPMGETKEEDKAAGFGADESFDAFLTMTEPPPAPQGTPARFNKQDSGESDDGPDFSIFIKPKEGEAQQEQTAGGPVPTLAPPPKSPVQNNAFSDSSPRFNPFDKGTELAATAIAASEEEPALPQGAEVPEGMQRTDSQETPPTPLFDEDVSQPLEEFPRLDYQGDGWEMHLRQPNKKKITGQRFWKKVFVRLVYQGDNPVLQLFNTKDDKDPFQELPLQACYSVSDIGAQQFDQYGKIFTVKLQYVFYKERPGVRPGQVTKAERITNKISQFAKYAMEGDYQGCKEFGSDLRKLGLPVEHAPQISQLFKIGSQTYEDMKQFSCCIEEALFRLSVHRDRALNYKTEEVQITVVDELHVEQDKYGHIDKQIARVRLFFLGFLAGMPDIELGVNDLWRQGKEVVGRHDIIPVITEEWIRLENVEFHSCVQQDEYERTRVIKFKPPDACYIELMRFRVRPPKNRELPLQLKTIMCITGNKVELKADILVPGFSSRKLGQIPCEDIMVRFPIPECWIYLFRVEKHFRYGSVKSAHRRTGKVKGIERFLGAVETLEQSLIEVTSGQAKYEHQHRAIVWRMARLPKEGQGAYTTHSFVCHFTLTSYDQIPENLAEYCYVEFTMPATQVSHTTVRSVSVTNGAKDDPPEKYVRYLARHEYRVGIEHTQGEGPGAYVAATLTKPPETNTTIEEKPEPAAAPAADSDSDSSS